MLHSAPSSDPEALQAEVWGLTVACPVAQDNPAGCPLHEIRRLPASTRLAWIKAISVTELQTIVLRHRSCLHTKEFLQCFE